MSLPHMSVATIKSPEFINLEPLQISPFMSKCEIKVFYLGQNRNGSYINEEVARNMAKTLRGCPIVGAYREEKEDYTDHGEQLIIDSQGVRFNCLTKPYGFVSPDAEVWFQEFSDTDEFGNETTRKYMMTNGYLWTEQYPEAKKIFDGGKPQSMELDSNTIEGHWAEDSSKGIDFFIITDAIFSKLCILGDDVEPCFEGAAVTAPSMSYSLDDTFKNTLFTMMKQLQHALGGKTMDLEMELGQETVSEEQVSTEEVSTENTDGATEASESTEDFTASEEKEEEEVETENKKKKGGCHTAAAAEPDAEAEGTDEQADPAETENTEAGETEEAAKDAEEADAEAEEKEEKETADEYSQLEHSYNELKTEFEALQTSYNELLAFKEQIDNEKKDALIAEFYMLSDDDKKEIVENKTKYSYEEIKSKLAVIAYDRKVNFEQESQENFENNIESHVLTQYSIDNNSVSTPEWIKAVEDMAKNMN